MNAIFWRKLKLFKSNNLKLVLFLLFPFLLNSVFFIKGISLNNIIIFTPYVFTSVATLIFFNIEDLIFSEVILATPINLKNIWLTSATFSMLTSYIYAEISLLIFIVVLKFQSLATPINSNSIILNLILSLFTIAMLLLSTIHLSDYSKTNQYIASFFALINFLSPFIFLLYGEKIYILNYSLIILAISIAILMLSFLLFGKGNVEKLIINSQKSIKTYNNDNNILSE